MDSIPADSPHKALKRSESYEIHPGIFQSSNIDHWKARIQKKIDPSSGQNQISLLSVIKDSELNVIESKVLSIQNIDDSDQNELKARYKKDKNGQGQSRASKESKEKKDDSKQKSENIVVREQIQQSIISIKLEKKDHAVPQQVPSVPPLQDIYHKISHRNTGTDVKNSKESQINLKIEEQPEEIIESEPSQIEKDLQDSIDIKQYISNYPKNHRKQPQKRNILHQSQNQQEQNNTNFQSEDLRQRKNEIPSGKALAREQPLSIQPDPIVLNQIMEDNNPLNHSLKNTLKRKLQQPPNKPAEIQLESSNEHLSNAILNRSLKRKIQFSVPLKSMNVQLGPQQEQSVNQRVKAYLKRNIKVAAPKPIEVRLQGADDHLAQAALKRSMKRNLEVLPLEKSFVAEVDPSIRIKLQQDEMHSLSRQSRKSLKRILEVPHPQPPTVIQIKAIGQQWKQPSNSINMRRALGHSQQLNQLDNSSPSKIFHDHGSYQEAALKIDENMLLNKRLQTIETPKKARIIRRAALEYSLNSNEISHQSINDEASSMKQIQPSESLRKPIHINPQEEKINNKVQILAKRHLEADKRAFEAPVLSKLEQTCQGGWIPTQNIFKLFRSPKTAKYSEQKSFTKIRINTSSLWH